MRYPGAHLSSAFPVFPMRLLYFNLRLIEILQLWFDDDKND